MQIPNDCIPKTIHQNKENIPQKILQLQFLAEEIQLKDKDIFTDYVEWVKPSFQRNQSSGVYDDKTLQYNKERDRQNL